VLDHFRIAGDDAHPSGTGGIGHGGHHALERLQWQAFFQNETGAQETRHGTGHGQVVHRTTDSQSADIPARKEERRDHVTVRRESQPAAVHAQNGRIPQFGEDRVAQVREEYVANEVAAERAAAAMGHEDASGERHQ